MNKKKQLQEVAMKMINIGAKAQTDKEMAELIHSLPRRDRRFLMREGKRAREQRLKKLEGDHGSVNEAGNIQEHQG